MDNASETFLKAQAAEKQKEDKLHAAIRKSIAQEQVRLANMQRSRRKYEQVLTRESEALVARRKEFEERKAARKKREGATALKRQQNVQSQGHR